MADEVSITVEIATEVHIVECGDEALYRVAVLIDGEEIGDIMWTDDELGD